MDDPRSTRFWQAALRSGLLDARQLQGCWDDIPPEKRVPDAIDRRLAQRAVRAGLLTAWQAQQILGGREGDIDFGRYRLLDVLGRGGMGRVYLARDVALGRTVAVKVLPLSRTRSPQAVARFQREARIGAMLQHENLVRLYDAGKAGEHHFLVMEYVEGESIGRLLADHGPMPPLTAARLVAQVALGLEHARQKGLIHRDISPWNILVTREGVAKVTDLGLAIALGDPEALTQDGATVGNYDYLSPDQAGHSRNVDARSDIYSLGCTFYHMLTNQVPFPAALLAEKVLAHLTAEPTPPSRLVAGLPPGLEDVVLRMMRKRPEERYQTPLEVAEALEPFLLGRAGPCGAGGPPPGWALATAPDPEVAPTVAAPAEAPPPPDDGEPVLLPLTGPFTPPPPTVGTTPEADPGSALRSPPPAGAPSSWSSRPGSRPGEPAGPGPAEPSPWGATPGWSWRVSGPMAGLLLLATLAALAILIALVRT